MCVLGGSLRRAVCVRARWLKRLPGVAEAGGGAVFFAVGRALSQCCKPGGRVGGLGGLRQGLTSLHCASLSVSQGFRRRGVVDVLGSSGACFFLGGWG